MTDERRIVVGFDGSEHGWSALRWALSRAKNWGADLEVVHVWQLPDFGGYGSSVQTLNLLEHHAKDVLDNALASVSDNGLEIAGRAVAGSPAAALLTASKGADMLVVGAHGADGIAGLLAGSTTDQCLHHSAVPVAVIRNEPQTGVHASRIVVGVDGSATSARALAWALDEARSSRATVTAVNAWHFVPVGGVPLATVYWSAEELEHSSHQVLDAAITAADTSGVSVDTVSACGSPATVLLDAANAGDLVVIGSRGLGGFASLLLGSTSTKVVHHADTNVVVIPPGD